MTVTYYQNACDLKVDILWRAGEPTDGTSDFDATSLVYLNRVHRALCMGGSELDPTIQEDWWWLRKSTPGVLILQPEYSTGTVAVTNNNTNVTFSVPPSFDADNWFLKITEGNGDVFRIVNHDAGIGTATLDSVYTGETDPLAAFRLFKLEYDVASDVLRIISPMRTFRTERNYDISGVDMMAMDRDYPIALVESGVPDRFAHADENTVRFNRSGRLDSTDLIRVEYDYLYMPTDLEDADTSIPAVPIQWRHILSDWGTLWLLMDKNDSRATAVASAARNGLAAMARENRHKLGGMGRGLLGSIQARQDQLIRARGVLRTDSGLIIG